MIADNGDVLVDGGYVNNLPVDVARSYADIVIAVDVEDKDNSSMKDIFNYGEGVSGWWILWQRLTSRKRFPAFGEMLIWLTCINHSRQVRMMTEAKAMDLYIRPPIEPFRLLDYLKIDQITDVGYTEAKKCLVQWLSSAEGENAHRTLSRTHRRESSISSSSSGSQSFLPSTINGSPTTAVITAPSPASMGLSATTPSSSKVRRNASMAMLQSHQPSNVPTTLGRGRHDTRYHYDQFITTDWFHQHQHMYQL